jgi:hypothetical protein
MMRTSALPVAALLLLSGQLAAQSNSRGETPRDSITRALRVLGDELGITALPAADSFKLGDQTIAAGTIEQRPVGVYGGDLTVRGTLGQSAVVVNGDLIVEDGGHIDGDAIAVRGRVVQAGGSISGSSIGLAGDLRLPGSTLPARSGVALMKYELGIALTTLVIVIALGIGVLMFAGGHLVGTAETLASYPIRSFFAGLFSQLALFPALALLIIALVLTVIGILLIPFAVVAFVLASLGLGALGLLASAHVIGTGLGGTKARELPERRRNLRALLLGILVVGSVWSLGAIVTTVPIVGGALRGFAVVMTWVAVTAGFGAVVISRAGLRRKEREVVADEEPDISWQTPTPVSGVAAARRPVTQPGVTK